MKYLSEFALKPGTQEEYKRRHDEIWPEMQALIRNSGIKNYSIWNLGEKLIEYYECDDAEKASKIIHMSDVKKRWDEYMSDILILNEDGSMTPYRQMFDLK